MSTCSHCGLPKSVWGQAEAGLRCRCFAASFAPQDPNRSGQAREFRHLTEDDVRRIVREELARDMEGRKAKLRAFVAEVRGADPDPINAGRTSKE